MLKQINQLFIILFCLIILTACSNRSLISEEKAKSFVDQFGITSFHLTIDTKEKKEAIAIHFEQKGERSEATYHNELDHLSEHGEKALTTMTETFQAFNLKPDQADEEVVKKIADVLEVNHYKMLKVNLSFKGEEPKELMFSK